MLKSALVLCLATVNCYARNGWHPTKAGFRPIGHKTTGHPERNANIHPGSGSHNLLELNEGDDVIPYYETWKMIQNARLDIEEHMNPEAEQHSEYSSCDYIVILGAIQHISDSIADTCQVDEVKYERDYMTLVQEGLTSSWSNLNKTADKINGLITEARQQTSELRIIIRTLCGENNESPLLCNMVLTKILHLAPKFYKRQTKLLLKLGKVATHFEEVSGDIEDVAGKHQEIAFLMAESTKELLKPLVLSTVDLSLDLDVSDICMNFSDHPVSKASDELKHIVRSRNRARRMSIDSDIGTDIGRKK